MASMYTTSRLAKTLRILFFGKADERRRVRQEMARLSAGLFGDFYLGDDHKIWREDEAFIHKFKSLSPHNLYSMERKWSVREFVRWTRNLEGDIAECGSYVGVTAWFIAKETPPDVNIFLFDSFEGLSEPIANDEVSSPDIHTWKKGDLIATEKELRKNLSDFNNIHIMKGWIPDRFPEVESHQFRFVHIDVDLYEPTLQSIEFFYPRLVNNGVIIMDDYGYKTCPGAYRAANDYVKSIDENIIHLPTGQGLIIRRT
ncbi:MAG: TylF/MycF family methyltransferase [Candidatus Thiodiazotropha sp. (ex Dulcina madagascariensis)]|nr:TylF/MycF family methyltransferase [Candidatus Thiodiazotropha sp. (ex Dulcina madagascariensis)]